MNRENIIKSINKWNEYREIRKIITKTIIAIDGTSSMSEVFPKVKDVLYQSFPRLYATLDNSNANGSF